MKLKPPLFVAALPFIVLFLAWSQASREGVSRIGLVVSEIMYQPLEPTAEEMEAGLSSADAFEFLEITNVSGAPVPVKDLEVTGAVNFRFAHAEIDLVGPGETVLVVNDRAGFTRRHGENLSVVGEFDGALPDDGGRLALKRGEEESLLAFRYGTGNRWPKTPQGMGFTLVLDDGESHPDHNVPMNWRASAEAGGSPGVADPESEVSPIYISEILPRETILDTYFRIASYPVSPDQAPTHFVTTFVEDMKVEPYDFSFIHLVAPDLVGHQYAWGSPEQDEAIRAVDVDLGEIFNLVDTDPRLRGKTVILLTTDHGGGGEAPSNHVVASFPINFTVHLHAWGPGIPAGADLYALNEKTRLRPDPKENPEYSLDTATMPIRNGDLGNLALDLLGLSAIPGSWVNHDQTLEVGADVDAVEYVIAISVDGLRPESIQRLGAELLPNLYRLRREGAYTDEARTDVDYTMTNPNHAGMLTGRGTLDHGEITLGHRVTFNSRLMQRLEERNGFYVSSVFDGIKAAGGTASFYSNKAKLDFLGLSYGALEADAIELHNPGEATVDISGWSLTDDLSVPDKFVIPDETTIPPGRYLILREGPSWRSPRRPAPLNDYFGGVFSLDPEDGELHLFSRKSGSLTGFDHGLAHGAVFRGATLARQPTSDGDRFAMAWVPTLGGPNASAFGSALVLTEWSLGTGDPQLSFVELRNVSQRELALGGAWEVDGACRYSFPEGVVVAPNQTIVVARDPRRLGPSVADDALLLGPLEIDVPWGDAGDVDLALLARTTSLLGKVIRVPVDRLELGLRSTWPQLPLTGGNTLERRDLRSFAGAPENWRLSHAAGGTPGRAGHGRYEDWVARHLSQVEEALKSPGADPDGDGVSNLAEYGFATDPLGGRSNVQPRLEPLPAGFTWDALSFLRPVDANDLIYEVEVSPDLVLWFKAGGQVFELAERARLGDDIQRVTLAVHRAPGRRFFRVRVRLAP